MAVRARCAVVVALAAVLLHLPGCAEDKQAPVRVAETTEEPVTTTVSTKQSSKSWRTETSEMTTSFHVALGASKRHVQCVYEERRHEATGKDEEHTTELRLVIDGSDSALPRSDVALCCGQWSGSESVDRVPGEPSFGVRRVFTLPTDIMAVLALEVYTLSTPLTLKVGESADGRTELKVVGTATSDKGTITEADAIFEVVGRSSSDWTRGSDVKVPAGTKVKLRMAHIEHTLKTPLTLKDGKVIGTATTGRGTITGAGDTVTLSENGPGGDTATRDVSEVAVLFDVPGVLEWRTGDVAVPAGAKVKLRQGGGWLKLDATEAQTRACKATLEKRTPRGTDPAGVVLLEEPAGLEAHETSEPAGLEPPPAGLLAAPAPVREAKPPSAMALVHVRPAVVT